MDWTGCELVEVVEGRCSGWPTVVGTRVFPEAIVDSFAAGESVAEIHENFPTVSVATIEGLIRFAVVQKAHTAA